MRPEEIKQTAELAVRRSTTDENFIVVPLVKKKSAMKEVSEVNEEAEEEEEKK